MSCIYVDWQLAWILPSASQHKRMTYQLLHIESSTSWWWAESLLKTCRD